MGQIRKNGIIYSGGPELIQPVIYSDEERCIGVWTDGKPLYEKTVVLTNLSSGTDVSAAHEIANIDTVVSYSGGFYSSNDVIEISSVILKDATSSSSYVNGQWTAAIVSVSKTNINYGLGNNVFNRVDNIKLTIRYTKTTDTAGDGDWTPSGVKTVHYSTNEHVVGTWIDGKTLYEKTVSFTIGTAATYTSYVTDINNPDENCMILDYGSSYYVKTGQSAPVTVGVVPYGTTSGSNDPEYSMAVLLAKADGKLRVDYRCGTQASGNTCYITLRYTKSSS